MFSQVNNHFEEFRHERKFLITDYSAADVEQIIKFNPACFKEIYHQRTVNNIYFDTLSFDNYYSNVDGNTDRVKARIRWYGGLFGEISDAVLEFKIKKGLLGNKKYYKLKPFFLSKDGLSKMIIERAVNTSTVPRSIYDYMMSVSPALLNSYSRKYFLSADKRFRLTIDKEMEFYKIGYANTPFLGHTKVHDAVVLELKYDVESEADAGQVATALPFAMTKNSKYLQGIERILF